MPRPADPTAATRTVTVRLTKPQAKALRRALATIEGDPDWRDILGASDMGLLYRAHNALLLAMMPPTHGR